MNSHLQKPAYNGMIDVPNTSISMSLYFMFNIHWEQGNLNLFNTLMELPVIFMGQQWRKTIAVP